MTSVDVAAVERLVREVSAEKIVPRFNRLTQDEVRRKQAGDLVTVADIEAERAIAPRLIEMLPGSVVVGEEAVAEKPALLDRLTGESPVWLIDPVDGTSNFAAGIPLFAVMVGLVHRGQMVAAWVFDPIKDLMATAETGSGAWANGQRLRVADPVTPEEMSGSISFRFGNRQLVRRIAGRSNLVGSVFSFRCAGQEYLALAAGRVHFALYHRLLPWDHVPGVLLHREAGGFGRRLDRSDYTPLTHDGGLLVTPDEATWEALWRVLSGPK